MKGKKGELTTQQIVILIILIISFVIILFFLIRANLRGASEEQICHNSVITRGNPALSGESGLSCERHFLCISADGSCERMSGNPEIKKVESLDEIYNTLAEEMADCWWIFGEGKVDYLRDKATIENYCSLCTQLDFDDSINEDTISGIKENKISKDEFYDYLAETEMSEGVTYADYLFGTNNIDGLRQKIKTDEKNKETITTFGEIEIEKPYFIVMGIVSEIGNFYKVAGISVALLTLATPVGWVGGAIIVGTGIGVAAGGETISEKIFKPEIMAIVVEGDGIENRFMAPTIVEANSEKFKLLKCKDIMTLS